jgi:hypothetical protein
MKKLMKWGETPWDDMSKEELLREVQRMFSALESATSALGGGQALDRASQVIDPVYEAYDAGLVYRSFFRYAVPLLFEVPDEDKWLICPICRYMRSGKDTGYVGTICSEHPIAPDSTCMGILRWLEWGDLAKDKALY